MYKSTNKLFSYMAFAKLPQDFSTSSPKYTISSKIVQNDLMSGKKYIQRINGDLFAV